MTTKLDVFNKIQLKKEIPDIKPGDTVKVYRKIKEKDKERIQIFEGIVIAKKHGKGISASFTVRKVISGIGVEKVFPLHSPLTEKIEIVKRAKVKRAKLYYLRKAKGKKAKLKRKDFAQAIAEESKEQSPEKSEEENQSQPEPEEK